MCVDPAGSWLNVITRYHWSPPSLWPPHCPPSAWPLMLELARAQLTVTAQRRLSGRRCLGWLATALPSNKLLSLRARPGHRLRYLLHQNKARHRRPVPSPASLAPKRNEQRNTTINKQQRWSIFLSHHDYLRHFRLYEFL